MENTAKEGKLPTITTRKIVNQALNDRDLPDLDDEEEMEQEEADEIDQGIDVNIFDHCHLLTEKGEVVSYDINKDSRFIAKKPHPYSWQDLQDEFGAGHYRVIARSERTKKFLKQQTQFVAQPPAKKENPSATAETIRTTIQSAMPPKENAFEQMSQMATLLKSLTPAPPPPVADNSSAMMMEFMKTMMSMNQSSQAQMTTLISEMNKSTTAMIDKIAESNQKMIEKLENKIEASKSTKDKGFDPMQLLTLVQSAEQRGMKNYIMLEQMADKRAKAMSGNSSSDDDEPKSMTDKLITTVLPSIASALAAKASQPAQPQMVAQRAPQVIAPRSAQIIPKANPTTIAPKKVTPVPTATIGNKAPEFTTVAVKPKTVVVEAKLPDKEQLLDAIMPALGAKLMAADAIKSDLVALEKNKKEAAMETLRLVKGIGATPAHLLQNVTETDMLDIAKNFGLQDDALTYLKEYYAHLKAFAKPAATTP